MNEVAVIGQTSSAGFSPEKGTLVTAISSDSSLSLLLATRTTGQSAEEGLIYRKLESVVHKVKKGRKKADHGRILRAVFLEGRRQFLHSYDRNYPHFSNLFTDGSYNCLTGTAMYAWVLQRLGYRVEIHETAFHAYLTLQAGNTVYLFDATDPLNGFVTGAVAVGKRALWYTGNELQRGATFHRSITFRQLCGLQYYNQAVVAFNTRDYDRSLSHVHQALRLYPQSERMLKLKEMALENQREMLAYTGGRTFVRASNEKQPEGE